VPGIHVYDATQQDADGGDKPGDDEKTGASVDMNFFLTNENRAALFESARASSAKFHFS